VHKWERPPEFSPGLTRAMQITVAGVDVDSPPSKSSSGKVEWFDRPADDQVGIFDVVFSRLPNSAHDWPGRLGMGTVPVFQTRLATGERLWVLWRVEAATPEFWIHREQAVRQQLPPAGERRDLDNPTASSRLLAGGEIGGMAMILDVSLSAVAKERLRYRYELWRPASAVQPAQFNGEMTSQLARSEGTIVFRYTLNHAISEPPPQTTTILETPPDVEVEAQLKVNSRMELVFSRACREVNLDLEPLRGGAVLEIYLALGAVRATSTRCCSRSPKRAARGDRFLVATLKRREGLPRFRFAREAPAGDVKFLSIGDLPGGRPRSPGVRFAA
jgi:hypothetical protein